MRTIVCYGDSNTWGFIAKVEQPAVEADNRFGQEIRWTGVLQRLLGDGYRVEEEGLNGRTTMFDDPDDPRRNGLDYIDICMLTKMPVDLVILMLGTNDVKQILDRSAEEIALGVERLLERVLNGGYGPGGAAPEVLLLSPAHLGAGIEGTWPGPQFGAGSIPKDARLCALYRDVAARMGVRFLDAADVAEVSPADCVHLTAEAHAALGERLAEEVRQILR